MVIKITKNKIGDKIEEYQKKTGCTKTWLSEKLGISRQRLNQLINSDNMMLDVVLKFIAFFDCEIKDLFEFEIDDNNI